MGEQRGSVKNVPINAKASLRCLAKPIVYLPMVARSVQVHDHEKAATDVAPVLSVENLHTVFHTQDGDVHAVNGVSFSLKP